VLPEHACFDVTWMASSLRSRNEVVHTAGLRYDVIRF
jgi:hypothetical protein